MDTPGRELFFWLFCNIFITACGQNHKTDCSEVSSFTLGKPVTIMTASSESKGEEFDNRYIGYFTILQMNPNLFYMYYECNGENHHISNHIAFAYSTDGFNWKKSYPKNISHEVYDENNRKINNSNLVFYQDIREFDVVKVPDQDYPFRMIANEWINKDKFSNDTQMCMWKSKDGVNFVDKIILLASKHDSQPSIIVRGNVLKVYLRLRSNSDVRERNIGYMYIDLDGKILSPPTKLSNDLYYTSSASILDDRREILFPTYYDQKHSEENHYEACLVENNVLKKIDADFNVLRCNDDKWGMISPHIITINHRQYIAYHSANFDHEGRTESKSKDTEFRLSKITFVTDGQACPPDYIK